MAQNTQVEGNEKEDSRTQENNPWLASYWSQGRPLRRPLVAVTSGMSHFAATLFLSQPHVLLHLLETGVSTHLEAHTFRADLVTQDPGRIGED
jgi:hypothetical protein